MPYLWSNQKRLSTLEVSGEDNMLTFEAGTEKAIVYMNNNDIEKVAYIKIQPSISIDVRTGYTCRRTVVNMFTKCGKGDIFERAVSIIQEQYILTKDIVWV